MELRESFQQQNVMPSQEDPFTVYWDALRRFFHAQLSKAELEAKLRSTLPSDAVALHNKLLLAMHAAAEKIVMEKAFDQGYNVPLSKTVSKRGGKGTRKHKTKQDAASAALLQKQAQTGASSKQQQGTGKIGVGVNMSGGSFGPGGPSRKNNRPYPLYKVPERRAWRKLLMDRQAPHPPQLNALKRRMAILAKRAGATDVSQDAALIVLAAAEHKLQTILASVTPTPPPREQQKGMQMNPFLIRPSSQRLAPDQQNAMNKVAAQAGEFNAQASQDPAFPLFRRRGLTVDTSPHSPFLPITLGPSCWVFSAPRPPQCLSHSTSTVVTTRDLRTLFDINPTSVTSGTATQIAL